MFQDFFKRKDFETKMIQDLLNDEYNESLSVLDMNVREEIKGVITTSTLQAMFPLDNINNVKSNIKEKHNGDNEKQLLMHAKQQTNERTPDSQIIRQQNVFVDRPFKKNPKKRLYFGSKEKPVNLKLNTIYEYMFDSKFSHEHSAEADCLAMIRCVVNIADFFLKWSDNCAIPLSYCKKCNIS